MMCSYSVHFKDCFPEQKKQFFSCCRPAFHKAERTVWSNINLLVEHRTYLSTEPFSRWPMTSVPQFPVDLPCISVLNSNILLLNSQEISKQSLKREGKIVQDSGHNDLSTNYRILTCFIPSQKFVSKFWKTRISEYQRKLSRQWHGKGVREGPKATCHTRGLSLQAGVQLLTWWSGPNHGNMVTTDRYSRASQARKRTHNSWFRKEKQTFIFHETLGR